MSLSDLPEIKFVDTDPAVIESSVITLYESISGRSLAPGDPVRLFLLSVVAIIVQQRSLIDQMAKQNLLRYASGDILDHMGAFSETVRLPAKAAASTVRFSLAAPRLEAVVIPAGVRVTPGNEVYFETTRVAEIPVGELFVDVLVSCTETGDIGNGYVPGQINILVDPQPWIVSVSNTTESAGGADRETDEAYRERINGAPERFSVAGPSGAYEYWARSANPDISDVRVSSPAPVEVEIRILMAHGELPTQEVLDGVAAVVNDSQVRPLTDQVTVLAPDPEEYDVEITYWIDTARATEATAIQEAVQQAVNTYILWQKSRIGRDINPSELVRLVMNAGARRVMVTSPTYTELDNTQVAIADKVQVTYGGLEDD